MLQCLLQVKKKNPLTPIAPLPLPPSSPIFLSLSLSLDSFHNFRSFQQLKTGYGFNLCWFLVELCYLTRFFIGSCICLSPHPHPHLHSMIIGLRLNLPVALLQLCFQTTATKTKAKKNNSFVFIFLIELNLNLITVIDY